MKIVRSILFIVIVMLVTFPCLSQREGADNLIKKANEGDAKSQYMLAINYFKGWQFLEKDSIEAVKWLMKSANNGYADAQDRLGYCYCMGEGVKQDYSKGVYWFEKAAAQKHANALRNLAISYEYGHGVSKDISQAIDLYKQSSENGNMDSQYIYAKYLLDGKYVECDSIEACFWLYWSARGGEPILRPKEDCKQNAADLLKKMADDDICSINLYAKYYYGKLCNIFCEFFDAEKYLQESYKLGCYEAAKDLGYVYYNSEYQGGAIRVNTEDDTRLKKYKNEKETSNVVAFRNRSHQYDNDSAEYWFEEALFRNLEDTDLIYWHLCNIYVDKKEYRKAAISLERFLATDNFFHGLCGDYLRLADLYLLSDYKADQAFKIYKDRYEAIETNSDNDLNDGTWYDWIVCGLGKCYYMGKGVDQSYERAAKFFKIASDNDDPEGLQHLSKCYRFGRGVTKDLELAEFLFKKAETLEDPTSLRIKSLLEY